MNQVSTVGLDLAKYIFQLHGADSAGAIVFRKTLRRGQLLAFLATLPPCTVAMEANAEPVRNHPHGCTPLVCAAPDGTTSEAAPAEPTPAAAEAVEPIKAAEVEAAKAGV